jgi:hypothetical protein
MMKIDHLHTRLQRNTLPKPCFGRGRFFLKNTQGFIFLQLFAAIIGAAALLTTLTLVLSSTVKSISSTQTRVASSHLLEQAKYMLAAETSEANNPGYPDATAGCQPLPVSPAIACATPAANRIGDGWEVPPTSGAPKVDGWGTKIKYCAWKNNALGTETGTDSTNSVNGRLAGDNPGTANSIVFAVISAGPDKSINTTCAQAKAGTAQVDDQIRTMTSGQVRQGVGGTVYFGDPVTTTAALLELPVAAIKKGQLRVVGDTLYINKNGTNGGTDLATHWSVVSGGGTGASLGTVLSIPVKSFVQNSAFTAFTPVTAVGGSASKTFSISPALPASFLWNTTSGEITDNPNDGAVTPTSALLSMTNYTVSVTDATGATSPTRTFALEVGPTLSTTLAIATKTVSKSTSPITSFTPVTRSGGVSPFVFSISNASTGGSLTTNTGLSFDTSTGAISGTAPNTVAQANYTVTVTDSSSPPVTSSKTFGLTISNYTNIPCPPGAAYVFQADPWGETAPVTQAEIQAWYDTGNASATASVDTPNPGSIYPSLPVNGPGYHLWLGSSTWYYGSTTAPWTSMTAIGKSFFNVKISGIARKCS